ncbi:MAG: hypothetical protein ACJ8JD_06510 [Chthoniobacterales bacterium]
MFRPVIASVGLCVSFASLRAQEAVVQDLPRQADANISVDSTWLDLRQTPAVNAKPQSAPAWVEGVSMGSTEAKDGEPAKTIFRIRLTHPQPELQTLLFRLFFDDKADAHPTLTAWDESGTQVLRSAPLGSGTNLPTSETVLVPMTSASTVDIEIPGDGKTVRGAYLDWMTSSEILHPINADHRELIPEPFAAAAPLHPAAQDSERFGTVTATLAEEVVPMGPSVQNGAAFQFSIEAQPLMALVSFEVASPNVDAPPEIYLNGESVGPVSLVLPELADPAYRGEVSALVPQMRFQYTGWVRAQKLVPASSLRAGQNDLLIIAGGGTPASAIRATQIQLKYLWDKSDYLLVPGH